MAVVQIKSVKAWHQNIAELLILHPHLSNRQLADHLGVTQSWLSVVINSDAFKLYMNRRRDEHFARASQNLVQKTEALAHVTLDAMTEMVESGEGSLKDLRETTDMCMKALGMTARATDAPMTGNTQNNNTTIVVASGDDLRAARESLKALQTSQEGRTIDAMPALAAPDKVKASEGD